MRWRKVSEYAAVSECGYYSVARIVIAGREHFELWHRTRDERGRVIARRVLRRGPSAKALVAELAPLHVEQPEGTNACI